MSLSLDDDAHRLMRKFLRLGVDFAVKIAKVLNVSVEYLICGDDAKVVPKEYSRFHPFRSILEDLSVLSDASIEKLQIMIRAIAENKK